jgi:arylsulfatase
MRFILIAQMALTLFCGCSTRQTTPNVIIIFTDDQGYGDLGCYGAKGFETPNIDKMAKDGIRFTDFYVSQAICSASRASLMTGSYSGRVGVQGAISPWNVNGLDPRIDTIAKLLKRHGYTNAVFGKWHLGHREKYLPLQNGFDEYAGLICSNDMWPVDYDGNPLAGKKKSYYPPMSFWEGNQPSEKIETLADQGQLTKKITAKAVDFINKNKDTPFFLYIPHPMPHQPIAASEMFLGKSELGLYGDVIMEIDWSVGQIIDALKSHEIDQNTLIIYASDNGPWLNYGKWGGSAGPLREGKGTMWEGGARVPCIMRWPEKINPGQVMSNIASTMDIFPTIAQIIGKGKINNKIDGISLLPLLEGIPDADPRDELYYYYGENLIAVRKKNYKLVFPHVYRSYENVEPGENLHPGAYSQGRSGLELYDLDTDIEEKRDISKQFPEIVNELQELGEKARLILGDKLTGKIGAESYETICGSAPPEIRFSHIAVGNNLELEYNPHKKYPGENINALVNGIGGTINYRDPSWQGYEAEDLIATVDLGEVKNINSVKVRFLQDQVVWIFLPKKVQIEHSVDGKKYEIIHESYPDNSFSYDQDIFEYSAELYNKKSRYIRVKGLNIDKCPEYHPGAGGASWVFADEIIVK